MEYVMYLLPRARCVSSGHRPRRGRERVRYVRLHEAERGAAVLHRQQDRHDQEYPPLQLLSRPGVRTERGGQQLPVWSEPGHHHQSQGKPGRERSINEGSEGGTKAPFHICDA